MNISSYYLTFTLLPFYDASFSSFYHFAYLAVNLKLKLSKPYKVSLPALLSVKSRKLLYLFAAEAAVRLPRGR